MKTTLTNLGQFRNLHLKYNDTICTTVRDMPLAFSKLQCLTFRSSILGIYHQIRLIYQVEIFRQFFSTASTLISFSFYRNNLSYDNSRVYIRRLSLLCYDFLKKCISMKVYQLNKNVCLSIFYEHMHVQVHLLEEMTLKSDIDKS